MTKPATARSRAKNDADARLIRTKAYQRLFAGNGSKEDAEMVLADLLNVAGYFRPPSYSAWMAKTNTPQGFELHCALQAARAEPIRHIMDFLALTDDQMIALERAAREDGRR